MRGGKGDGKGRWWGEDEDEGAAGGRGGGGCNDRGADESPLSPRSSMLSSMRLAMPGAPMDTRGPGGKRLRGPSELPRVSRSPSTSRDDEP